jgi:hypothetical protein
MQRFYGLVFIKMMVRFAVEFEAKMIGDSSPPQVETIQECKEYIINNLEKYPDGFASIVYGIIKAENTLQGGTGAGVRTIAWQGALEMRYVLKKDVEDAETANTKLGYQALVRRAEKAGILWESLLSKETKTPLQLPT